MGLETVVEDIKQEARDQAEEIRREAEQEREEILEEARREAEEIREDVEQETTGEIESRREQELSSAKLEARKMKSRERKALLEELRGDVEDALRDLSDGRRDLTESLFTAAVEELDEDEGVVYSAERDEDMVRELVDGEPGYTYGGTEEMLGGVVVEAEDGDVRIDNTFDSILDGVWQEELGEVSDRLFGER